jgi:hypothetical protein
MLNALALRDNGPPPSECPIHPRNPPDPHHPRSIISQNEFANSIIPVPSVMHSQIMKMVLARKSDGEVPVGWVMSSLNQFAGC